MRIPLYLQDCEVLHETLIHPPAYTAQRRAKILQVPGRQLLKSVLLKCGKKFRLAVLPATHNISLSLLESHFSEPVRFADNSEIVEVFRDCEWGVRVPFGSLYGISTILETSIDPESEIVFEAHYHSWSIRMSCRDFENLEQPERLPFSQPVHPPRSSRRMDWRW